MTLILIRSINVDPLDLSYRQLFSIIVAYLLVQHNKHLLTGYFHGFKNNKDGSFILLGSHMKV